MDRMDADSVERMNAAISELAASPGALHRYCMNSAGY